MNTLTGTYFSRDTVGSPSVMIGSDLVTDVDTADFPVTAMSTEFQSFFNTSDAYEFDVTVAKPIPQEYSVNDGTITLKKPGSELAKSAMTLDGAPWTIRHPGSKQVTQSSQVRGVFSDPRYSYADEKLSATLSAPTNDDEAIDHIRDTNNVSMGFYNEIETDELDNGIDGYQTEIVVDHVASVDQGRCDDEDGCKVHVNQQ